MDPDLFRQELSVVAMRFVAVPDAPLRREIASGRPVYFDFSHASEKEQLTMTKLFHLEEPGNTVYQRVIAPTVP